MARKFKFAAVAQKPEIPKQTFIWNVGYATCPHCRMIMDLSLKVDDFGNPLNYDTEANTITTTHPGYPEGPEYPKNQCVFANRKLRWKMPSIPVEVVG